MGIISMKMGQSRHRLFFITGIPHVVKAIYFEMSFFSCSVFTCHSMMTWRRKNANSGHVCYNWKHIYDDYWSKEMDFMFNPWCAVLAWRNTKMYLIILSYRYIEMTHIVRNFFMDENDSSILHLRNQACGWSDAKSKGNNSYAIYYYMVIFIGPRNWRAGIGIFKNFDF